MGGGVAKPSLLALSGDHEFKAEPREVGGLSQLQKAEPKDSGGRGGGLPCFQGGHTGLNADSPLRSTVHRSPGLSLWLLMGLWRTSWWEDRDSLRGVWSPCSVLTRLYGVRCLTLALASGSSQLTQKWFLFNLLLVPANSSFQTFLF